MACWLILRLPSGRPLSTLEEVFVWATEMIEFVVIDQIPMAKDCTTRHETVGRQFLLDRTTSTSRVLIPGASSSQSPQASF